MCTIEKMLVKGIRSFSPDNTNVIEFYKPLTLIVGSNGAGKTTIIECLKQACTGELPPNVGGNGRNWVMDPKVAGEPEVKAQIKLRLRSSNGAPFVVVRSFQSVQKKATLQFKSLDATLQSYNAATHRKEAITYRCADINAMVPHLMGINKAVLDNVIFVHQEESNWPLADGATIKRKFDDIFAATKYTKALESLRKLRLEKTQEAKEMKLRLETLRVTKDAAAKLAQEAADGAEKAAALEADIGTLQARVDAAAAELAALDEKLTAIAELADEISRLRAQEEVLAASARSKLERLKDGDYAEDDAALEEAYAAFTQDFAEYAQLRESRMAELRVKQLDQASFDERISSAQQRLNRLAAAAEAHVSNVRDRDAFVRRTAAQLGVRLIGDDGGGGGSLAGTASASAGGTAPAAGTAAAAGTSAAGGSDASAAGAQQPPPLPQAALQGFVDELRHRTSRAEAGLSGARASHEQEEAALAARTDAANADLARAEQSVAVKQADRRALEGRRENLHQQLMAMAGAAAESEELRVREAEVARRLEARRAEEARANFEGQLAEARGKMEQLGQAVAALRAERDRAIMAGEAAGKLRAARVALTTARARLDAALAGGATQRLLELVGNPSPVPHGQELKRLADEALRVRDERLAARRAALQEAEGALAEAAADLNAKRRERVAAETSVQEARGQLRRAISGLAGPLPAGVMEPFAAGREEEAFAAALAHLEARRNEVFSTLKTAEAVNDVIELFVTRSREACVCQLCNRGLSEQDVEAMRAHSATLQSTLPQRRRDAEAQVADLDRQLAALNALLGDQAGLQRQLGTLPGLRAREEQAASGEAALRDTAVGLGEEVAIMEAELAATRRSVGETAWSLSKQAAEVDALSAELEAARAGADAAGAGGLRERDELDAELAELESQQRHAEVARDDVARRQGRLKDERVRLSEELAAVREELRRASEANRARSEATNQLRDVGERIAALTEAITAAAAATGPAKAARDALLAQRDAQRAAQQAREQELAGRVKELVSLADGYAARSRLVDDYGAAQKQQERAALQAELDALSVGRADAAQAVVALTNALEQAAQEVNQRELLKADLELVRDYRATKREAEGAAARIAALRARVDAHGDRRALEAARHRADAARSEARRAQDTARGSLQVVEDNRRAAQRGLKEARYAGIAGRYRRQMVELKTTEYAAGDLDKYTKALERALLAFHTGKMADINRIVRELWQRTYRGGDIDYVQIRADAEGTARSYNYRVVMVSGGVELDMRGRCSAGQKVLACLVIRLALAETFCVNCGILALDEPTTNLDAENSASLAEALRAVMAARAAQDNFQLVVITHDEAFARLIGTRQHAEWLWRITKDDDQRSHISQEEILG